MNKVKLFAFLILFIIAGSCASKSSFVAQQSEPEILNDGDILSVEIENAEFNLVVSQSSRAKMKGLSDRDEIPQDGMIFLFNEPQYLVFWMKDMRFAIDIIWVNGNEVIGVAENALNEPAETTDDELKKYHSPAKADKVIELNAGAAKKFNIKEGSIINIKTGENNGK